MDLKRIIEYKNLIERIAFYYEDTSCSTSQISRHFNISQGKVSQIINKKYPKFYQEYLNLTSSQSKLTLIPDGIEIDWQLLKFQKLELMELLKGESNTLLWGLVNMIDAIQDELIDAYGYDEKEVLGT